jgi:hypothetical protein
LAELLETWAMRWSRSSGGEIGAGAALQDTTGPTGARSTDWVPVATATVWYALLLHAMQANFRWSVGHNPQVNVLAGTLQSRVFTSAQADLTVDGTSLIVQVGAAQTLPRDAPDATELISADLAFEQGLLDWLSLQLGAQLLRQRLASESLLAASGTQWLLYGGLAARAPEVHF